VALALCLFLSWLSAKIGVAAIIGAFFAGLMFADYAPRWNLLPRVGGITEFLAPFFFFTIGSRLTVHAVCGKCAICRDCDFFSGHRFQGDRMRPAALARRPAECIAGWVGVGMMPRGEVALIVALVGLRSQIVLPSTYAIVVFMTAVTTILAPPLLRYLFHGEMKPM